MFKFELRSEMLSAFFVFFVYFVVSFIPLCALAPLRENLCAATALYLETGVDRMPTALLGLGSNLGDREATLRAALAEIDALPNVRLQKTSGFRQSQPLGGPPDQGEYLNAAAIVVTTVPPLSFLEHLGRIEARHGRVPTTRWAARTLDIDLLLYGSEVIETEMLIVPHVRMTFRRFVLEPAAEIAAKIIHPTIGWPIERLLLHLNEAKDELAVLSPSKELRTKVSEAVAKQFGARPVDLPTFATAAQHWSPEYTTWLALDPPTDAGISSSTSSTRTSSLPYAAAAFPKLTVLLDSAADAAHRSKAEWSRIVRQPGRGPTLRLQTVDWPAAESEVFAAIHSVWPDLGPNSANRLK
jgi:2-amino-4-hydroxy-6-hydroxymethyldihydropteridine diphosphokinase